MLGLIWAAGIALGVSATPPLAVPHDHLLDSLGACEGIMAYRVVYDSTAQRDGPAGTPERRVRSSAIEGELKDRWLALVTGPGLEFGPDCEPVCLRCEDRPRYRLYFPPLAPEFSVNVHWQEHRVLYVSNDRVIAHRTLSSVDSAWVTLLQITFPTDSVTRQLVASDQTPRRRAPPNPDDFIYVETLPEVKLQAPPPYPPGLANQGVGGEVRVLALVGPNGRVLDAFAKEPVEGFDEVAVVAVRQWQFKAARCGGNRIAVWVLIPVKFSPN